MNRRYILLSSSYRNRNDFPNPFDFSALSQGALGSALAADWLSEQGPVLNFDMGDYFLDTDANFTAPYQWRQTGVVTAPSTLTWCTVTIDARLNAGDAPDPVEGQYVGCIFEQGGDVRIIEKFEDNLDGTFKITFDAAFTVTADPFEIFAPFLELDDVYIPQPVANVYEVDNAYTGYFIVEVTQGIVSEIATSSKTTRIVQGGTNFTLTGPGTFPRFFAVQKLSTFVQYELTAVDFVTNELSVAVADNPTITLARLANQYIYEYPTASFGQIIPENSDDPTEGSREDPAGTFILKLRNAQLDATIAAGDFISILYFSYDNAASFDYLSSYQNTMWQDRGQVRINSLELLSLQIPNRLFKYGGYPVNYPFFFVDLINLSSEPRNDGLIYSNNPHVGRATFVCPVLDISTPAYSSFTKLDGNGFLVPFNIKTSDSLQLRIRAPNGQVLEDEIADTEPPIPPNPFLQVSAVFAVTQRDGSGCYECGVFGRV